MQKQLSCKLVFVLFKAFYLSVIDTYQYVFGSAGEYPSMHPRLAPNFQKYFNHGPQILN